MEVLEAKKREVEERQIWQQERLLMMMRTGYEAWRWAR
jgi:hypothetical protein